jgi:hypothetical protein
VLLWAQAGSGDSGGNHAGDYFRYRASAIQWFASISNSLYSAALGKAERLVVTLGGAL